MKQLMRTEKVMAFYSVTLSLTSCYVYFSLILILNVRSMVGQLGHCDDFGNCILTKFKVVLNGQKL